MRSEYLKTTLRFCCIIDEAASGLSLTAQAEAAMRAGATMIRYTGSGFSSERWAELRDLCRLCQSNRIVFSVRDHLLLAKSLEADGFHLDQSGEHLETVRKILGPETIIGKNCPFSPPVDVSTLSCDYVELTPFTPVFPGASVRPLITAGGISEPMSAQDVLSFGAAGVTISGSVFLSQDPASALRIMAESCGCSPRSELETPWRDEFGLIEKLLKQAPETRSGLIVPPGDDACLLSPISHPVISTDTHKEGVHFRLDWQSPEEIGEKAVSVTLSDLAVSYARPVSLFVNLGLPPRISDVFTEALYRGIRIALERYDCSLGGGNISAGRELSLDLFAIGRGREDIFPRRSEAKPGFGLYATGPLGLARAGLEALLKNEPDFPDLIDRFKHPRARFDAAEILASNSVTCVMDISDGLMGDAAHMAKASNLSIELDASALPQPDSLKSFCRKYGHHPEAFALAGGEDYELLFACQQEAFLKIKASLPEAFRVGRCLPFQGRRIISPDIGLSPYRHGA